MGARHARLISQAEGLELYGICDSLDDKLARAESEMPGIKLFHRFEDAFNDSEVDLVSIVTPHNTHKSMAIQALDAGKHCVTDKPISLTVSDLREMILARDRNSRMLSTFQNRRWDPDFLTIRQLLKEEVIGRLYNIETKFSDCKNVNGWRAQKDIMGGWLYDWGAHMIDQVLILANSRPIDVYAFSHFGYDSAKDVEDYIRCVITFENGITGSIMISYLHRIKETRWQIIGDKGAIMEPYYEAPLQVRTEVGGIESDITVPLYQKNWLAFYQNISDYLAGNAELAVQAEQLLPQIAIAEAAYKSIAKRQVVPVLY
jgi:predicted dehydrogenase